MATPDITKAQVLAFLAAVLALLAAFGLNLSKTETDAIVQVATVGLPVIVAADAVIRHGRSKNAAAQANLAAAQIAALPADAVDKAA